MKKCPEIFGYFGAYFYLCTAFQQKVHKFGLWCNGSTTGFGSVCPSSNLGSPTKEGLEREIFRGFLFRITLMALSIVLFSVKDFLFLSI